MLAIRIYRERRTIALSSNDQTIAIYKNRMNQRMKWNFFDWTTDYRQYLQASSDHEITRMTEIRIVIAYSWIMIWIFTSGVQFLEFVLGYGRIGEFPWAINYI